MAQLEVQYKDTYVQDVTRAFLKAAGKILLIASVMMASAVSVGTAVYLLHIPTLFFSVFALLAVLVTLKFLIPAFDKTLNKLHEEVESARRASDI